MPRFGYGHRACGCFEQQGVRFTAPAGCIGCHKYAGFDDEPERLNATRQQITQLESTKHDYSLEIPRLNHQADIAPDNDTARKLNARATSLTVESSKIDAQIQTLESVSYSLMRESKRVGPDLKEVRMKLRKEWIPGVARANAHLPADDEDAAVPA